MPQLWEVIGGASAGGILVREGESLRSHPRPERLAQGSLVAELVLTDVGRLCYKRITGSGPESGWVSIKANDKALLERREQKGDSNGSCGQVTRTDAQAEAQPLVVHSTPAQEPSDLRVLLAVSRRHADTAVSHADLRLADGTWRPPSDTAKRKLCDAVRVQLPVCKRLLHLDCMQEGVPAFAQRFLAQSQAWGWSLDFSPDIFCELAYEGFVPTSLEVPTADDVMLQVMLLWWGAARSILNTCQVHVSRRVLKSAQHYSMTIDQASDDVLLGCVQQHGEGWLHRGIRWLCRRLFREGYRGSRSMNVGIHSFELWDVNGQLVAGDVGYALGSMYMSMTGFRRPHTSGSGEVQLVLMVALLHKMGYEWIDLGVPEPYKDSLGAENVSRDVFLKLLRGCRERHNRPVYHRVGGEELLTHLLEGRHLPEPERELDPPNAELHRVLAPIRARLENHVADCLQAYDDAHGLPRREDYSCSHRNGYEAHLRGKALKELRTEISIWCRQRASPERAMQGPIAILALLAAHVRTMERAQRLRDVLQSIAQQEIRSSEVELVVALSWSAVSSEVAAAVRRATGSLPGLIAVQQRARHSQFQHLSMALAAAEKELLQSRGACPAEEKSSVWVVFGDDDDLWHHRRVAEYARAIRSHPMLDGVGVFATLNRANCRDGKVADAEMPCNEDQVEALLGSGRGYRVETEEPFSGWYRRLHAAGGLASSLPVPDEVFLEYFDFCPRLRLVREFFGVAPQHILTHRYCDLRFGRFLRTYPLKGREAGLELAFFRPDCWMYFYACSNQDEHQWKESLEGERSNAGEAQSAALGSEGHMSSELEVEKAEVELAGKVLPDFQAYEEAITPLRLERYWAAFRGTMEVFLLPWNEGKIDQRIFDAFVAIAASRSFGTFAEVAKGLPKQRADSAWRMMCMLGQGFAKDLAISFDVSVLWHDTSRFMEPVFANKGDDPHAEAGGGGVSLAGGSAGGKESWGKVVPQSHSKHGVSTFFWW